MRLIQPDFEKLLTGFDAGELNRVENTNFGLWPDLTFAFFNDGWFHFSEVNKGEPRISREWTLGRPLLEAIPDILHEFFIDGFRKCLAVGKPWEHEYDCSSPEIYRLMHQIVYPLGRSEGFLVVNSVRIERHIGELQEKREPDHYVDPHGIVHQCARCRRVENLAIKNRWDWIPAWVASPLQKVSHGLCPVCLDYYYPGARNKPL
jgi:hypothetical protein